MAIMAGSHTIFKVPCPGNRRPVEEENTWTRKLINVIFSEGCWIPENSFLEGGSRLGKRSKIASKLKY